MPFKRQAYSSTMRRCVAKIAVRLLEEGEPSVATALSRAFAICTAGQQRAGHLAYDEDGRQGLTDAGRSRQRHHSALGDRQHYDALYERLLEAARSERAREKNGSVRVRNAPFAEAKQARHGDWHEITQRDLREHPEIAANVFDLIEHSYRPLGGHLGLSSIDDLYDPDLHIEAVDVDDDPDADAVLISKGSRGYRKGVALASDGSALGKQQSLTRKAANLFHHGHITEASGPLAHILITRYGVPYVGRAAVMRIMHDKKIHWFGEHPEGKYPEYRGWYERVIGGKPVVKIMLGTV
jgi:hypothetical protein